MDRELESCLAFAAFDLWMSRELEQLVNRWAAWAAPCDRGLLIIDDHPLPVSRAEDGEPVRRTA